MTSPSDGDWIKIEEIDEPWLVVTDKDLPYAVRSFASRLEADTYVRERRTETMGDATYPLRVLRDSASARVLAGVVSVTEIQDLKRRETWLKRCSSELKGALIEQCSATFVVWEPRVPEQLLQTRFGGPGIVSRGQVIPTCRTCRAAQTFVALLDFAGTEIAHRVPLLWCAVYYCMRCVPGKSESVLWFDGEDPLVEVPAAMHAEFGDARTGRRCKVTDFLLDRKVYSRLLDRADLPGSLLKGAWFDFLRPDGTKLGGHTNWIQASESHQCSCGAAMEYVAQIASLWNFMFADAGALYIFVCPRHGCGRSLVCMQSF